MNINKQCTHNTLGTHERMYNICQHTFIPIYISLSRSLYICIYIYREREREIDMHIYIYIYILWTCAHVYMSNKVWAMHQHVWTLTSMYNTYIKTCTHVYIFEWFINTCLPQNNWRRTGPHPTYSKYVFVRRLLVWFVLHLRFWPSHPPSSPLPPLLFSPPLPPGTRRLRRPPWLHPSGSPREQN